MNKVLDLCRENLYDERVRKDDEAEDILDLVKIWEEYRHRIFILIDTHHCPKGDEAPCRNCAYPLIRI